MISEKPWSLDAAIRLGLRILGTACVGILLAGLLDSEKIKLSADHREFAQMAVVEGFIDGGALVWIGLFLRENHLSLGEAFGLERWRQSQAVKWGLLAAVLFVPVALGLEYFATQLMQHPEAQELVQVLQKADLPTGERAFIGFLAVLVAPVAEETMFRGILYPTLKQLGYPRASVWVTSLLFAGMHFNIPSFVPLAAFSVLLIYLYEKTGSLLASITAHSLFNFVNFVFLMLASTQAAPISVK